jgi:multidrug efflux pump subunit AcrA (membrane-fusion protein)
MMRNISSFSRGGLLATTLIAVSLVFGAHAATAVAEDLVLPECLIMLKQEVKVPAQEAGVLIDLPVVLGQQVKKGEVLAQIDDKIPQAQVAVAEAKLHAAQKEASSMVAIDYSTASFERAKGELAVNEEANRRAPGVTTEVRMKELELKCTEARLSIDKAHKDQDVAIFQADVAKAELNAAQANCDHRRILSTLDGEVIEIFPHVGEWLQNGEPIMRIVEMDKLWVSAHIDTAKYRQVELRDKPVTLVVQLPQDRSVKLPGKIFFVSPEVERGRFLVRAEVQNRQEKGVWVLNPGLYATMIIQMQ